MTETPLFVIENLHVTVEGKEILKGVDLVVDAGEVHALMGPNGSGKSTLANVIMGHPQYEVTEGRILFKGTDVTELEPDERARLGIFLAFQYPVGIPGVTMVNFLRMAMKARRGQDVPVIEFRRLLKQKMAELKIDESFATRYINDGFSGGEKKKSEVLQMALLQPELAILDETDSGLDIDALRTVSEGVNACLSVNPAMAALVITHYTRILNYIKPHKVHVLYRGRIVREGGPELAEELEATGYDPTIAAAEAQLAAEEVAGA